jgi:hypothetical protein
VTWSTWCWHCLSAGYLTLAEVNERLRLELLHRIAGNPAAPPDMGDLRTSA